MTMIKSNLSAKDGKILNYIVEQYVHRGRPVSSGQIAQSGCVEASSATIRNIMVRLESLGYLVQPHTSAGRIPTDLGLRHYVNSILAEVALDQDREQYPVFQETFSDRKWDFGSLLSQTSRVLADFSDNVGFVISPHISHLQFQKIRFIKVSDERILIILITPFNMVMTDSIQSELMITQAELDEASHFINKSFRGQTLAFVLDIIIKELPRYKARLEKMVDKFMDIIRSSVADEESEKRLYLQGASRLLEKTDRFDLNRLRLLFRSIEERTRLVNLLSDIVSLDRVKVLIGSEANISDIQDCSLILSHYGYKNQVLGSLGIIGPKRIAYDKIIPLVDRIARKLNHAISVCKREVTI